MARTSQKRYQELMREIRVPVGLRTNQQVLKLVHTIEQRLQHENPNKLGLTLGPYKDHTWGVYWLGKGCCERFVSTNANQLLHDVDSLSATVQDNPD